MAKKTVEILPGTQDILCTMGEQIKLARLRRNLPVELVAERADISRATLWKVEKGDKTVAIGIYAAVLHALSGMDKDLLLVAKDDVLGRTIQDLKLTVRRRASAAERKHSNSAENADKPTDARVKSGKCMNWRNTNDFENNLKNLKGTFAVENMTVSDEGIKNLKRIEHGKIDYTDVIEELKLKYMQRK